MKTALLAITALSLVTGLAHAQQFHRLEAVVSIKADAYPDTEFEGTITSFSPATGARFSLLPPDNATGNFVKTIQRLPVKISLNSDNDANKVKLLRPGMNVDVDVHLK